MCKVFMFRSKTDFFLPKSFGKTFYLAKLHLANFIWQNFILPNQKINFAKLHLAWIGHDNPFLDFGRFSNGYPNGYRLYWESERECDSVTPGYYHIEMIYTHWKIN